MAQNTLIIEGLGSNGKNSFECLHVTNVNSVIMLRVIPGLYSSFNLQQGQPVIQGGMAILDENAAECCPTLMINN